MDNLIKKYICVKPTKQMTKGKKYVGKEVLRNNPAGWWNLKPVTLIEIVNDLGYKTAVSPSRLKRI